MNVRSLVTLISLATLSSSLSTAAAADRTCLEGDCALDGAVRAALAERGLTGEATLSIIDPFGYDATGEPLLGLRIASTDRLGLTTLADTFDTEVVWRRGSSTGFIEAPFYVSPATVLEDGSVVHEDLLSPTQEPGSCVGDICCVEVDGELICWERW